ncbi:MAG: alkaline phosphatase family protein [Gaiella sp.]
MTPRKLVLTVVDGLTPGMLEGAAAAGLTPTLAAVAERGLVGTAVSTFPSLTPVCLASIATGAHGDVHEIPHLVWWHRGSGRVVEYGSSFGAVRAAGIGRSLHDTIVAMNAEHLGGRALTLFEALADAGLRTAAVNFTAYRGRTPHRSAFLPLGTVRGPEQFYFYNLFATERTGAPLSFRNRSAGTIDRYATAVGRWLVTRDAFDFLLFYLSDYDYASHAAGPDSAVEVLARCDAALGRLVEAGGGLDAFLDRYALLVIADHGQTHVREVATLGDAFRTVDDVFVGASNRAAGVYRLGTGAPPVEALARRLDSHAAVDLTIRRDQGAVVVRRGGEELRLTRGAGAETVDLDGEASLLDHPDGLARVWAAAHCPNAGDLLVSAAEGFEFADLGGGHHRGGGSHGSLLAGDSVVPALAVGLERLPRSIVDVAPAILDHFGVTAPPYALDRAA